MRPNNNVVLLRSGAEAATAPVTLVVAPSNQLCPGQRRRPSEEHFTAQRLRSTNAKARSERWGTRDEAHAWGGGWE